MKHIATGLIFDRNHKLLIYLRDNKPSIPFPNYWDLFGGIVESGETPEDALVREIQEELGITLKSFHKFKEYKCTEGDAFENIKHVYWSIVDYVPSQLTLQVGQRLDSIYLKDRHDVKFANILAQIVDDFANSGLLVK